MRKSCALAPRTFPLDKSFLDRRTELNMNSFSSRCFPVYTLSDAPVFQYNVVRVDPMPDDAASEYHNMSSRSTSRVNQIAALTHPYAFLFPYCWQQ